jgi:hypothetical protein
VAGTSAACSDDPAGSVPDPRGAAVTEFPGLEPAADEATLPGLETSDPPPRTVTQVAGPFDDRFTLSGLRVDEGVVTGRLRVTSDVSDLLELEVVVGFYDAGGGFLGTARAVHHVDGAAGHPHDDGPPSEVERFDIAAPACFAQRVSSAVVGVPVLVNE